MTDTIEVASTDAEMLLLGRMINSTEDRKICCASLKETHFFYSENKIVFNSLCALDREDKPSEVHLLIEILKSQKLLDKAKGAEYLLQLAQLAPSSLELDNYLLILKSYWAKRAALEEVRKFSIELSKTSDVPSFLESFSKRFSTISKDLVSNDTQSFAEVSALEGNNGYLADLSFRREFFATHKKPFVDGVSSGYADLDETIGGFGNSNLIIVASRPGMGKTALALNFAQRISSKHPVGIVSLEMSSVQLYERMLSMESEVPGSIIREGRSSDDEWERIKQTEPRISRLPIYIQEGSYFVKELVAKARQLKEDKGIKLLIIDYLQLLRASGENRLMEISNITRDLKNLSMELHIPIVCLAQLSRKVEERTTHRPMLSDLRESGTIEQDADVVMFLLRNDYYDEKDRPGEADLIVAKNRHGGTGDVLLHFSKKFAKFDTLLKGDCESNDLF